MNRRNITTTALALTALAFAPACGNKDKSDGSGSSGAAAGSSAEASNILSYLPKDSSAVFAISVSKMQSSSLYKTLSDKAMEKNQGEIDKIKEKCGIDVLKDLKTVVVSLGKSLEEEDMVLALKGNFDKAKVEACVTKMEGTVKDGVYTMDGEPANVYWPNDNTMLMSPKLTADKMKSAGSLKDNADLIGLIGKVDKNSTFWAVGNIPPQMAGMGAMMGVKPPTSAYLSVSLSTGVDANLGVVFASEEDAKASAGGISGGLAMLKGQSQGIINDISSKQDGTAVVISAKLSADELKKAEGMIQ